MCRCSAARLQRPLCIFPGNETAHVSVTANRMKRSSRELPQRESQAAVVCLLVGSAFVSSSSPVPSMPPAVQPGGHASFLGLRSGFSYLKATPSPSFLLFHPPPPPSPTRRANQDRGLCVSCIPPGQGRHIHTRSWFVVV